jgi:aerobic carbon-monoxide dehydrogenase large subunit
MTLQRFGSGHGVRRIEDPALLAGRGQFTDDVQAADQAVLVFLRSPYAHARILSINTRTAEAAPGVLAVLTGAALQTAGVLPFKLAVPFPQADGSPAAAPPHPALAVDTVHYVGQTVAAVVARTRLEALDAIELIEIHYDSLPAVADVHSAVAPGAPQVWAAAKGNVASAIQHGDAAVVAQAFERAAHRVALTIHNQRLSGAPLEPRVVSAGIDAASGRLSVRLSSQQPTSVRGALAGSLGMPVEQIRVQAAASVSRLAPILKTWWLPLQRAC